MIPSSIVFGELICIFFPFNIIFKTFPYPRHAGMHSKIARISCAAIIYDTLRRKMNELLKGLSLLCKAFYLRHEWAHLMRVHCSVVGRHDANDFVSCYAFPPNTIELRFFMAGKHFVLYVVSDR